MTHYLSAAISSVESFGEKKAKKWFCQLDSNDGVNIYLVKSNGKILSCALPNQKVKSIRDKLIKTKEINPFFRQNGYLIQSNDKSSKYDKYWLITNSKKIIWVKNFGRPVVYRLLVASFLAILLVACVLWLITFPIEKLVNIYRKMASGHFNHRLEKEKTPSLKDIKYLNDEFNKMSSSVEKIILLKDDLLHIISHELKSPLARQRSALNLLKKETNFFTNDFIKVISNENYNITSIINQTLEYLALFNSTTNIKKDDVNLKDLCSKIIDDFSIEDSTTLFNININSNSIIKGDAYLLEIALKNILSNSIKYSANEKEIHIKISANKNTNQIIIKDKGLGVKEKNLDKIFEPYFREISNDSNIKGHGLGLAITKRIIKLHQGEIKAKNNNHQGLTIIISLPIT